MSEVLTPDKKKVQKTERKEYDGAEGSNWVYHVENPDVPGVVIKRMGTTHVYVHFFQPVGFRGNAWAGIRHDWGCSVSLLFPTPEEARANRRTG